MKKRMGVFVLYDRNGVIDQYIDYLVSSMRILFHKLVIVVNGYIQKKDLFRLKKYTQHIYIRKNKGFDAGAYKDVFLKYIPWEEWREYDEITLWNDTFFGPVYSLNDMWKRFESVETDFWGITRHSRGTYADETDMPSHIQAYFLTIRKRMLQSKEFLLFWEKMTDLGDVCNIIKEFEVSFTTYFEECGFKGKALMDLGSPLLEMKYNENPYFTYNLRLIRDKGIPFLKKKSLLFQTKGYEETIAAIEYMENKHLYDTSLIWDNIFRLSRESSFRSIFNYWKLENFYRSHKRIFIYGAGKYGQRMKSYFKYRKWFYVCFFVSREEDVQDGCVKYDFEMILPSDGIIMALNQKNLEEVLNQMMDKVSEEQLLLPERFL